MGNVFGPASSYTFFCFHYLVLSKSEQELSIVEHRRLLPTIKGTYTMEMDPINDKISWDPSNFQCYRNKNQKVLSANGVQVDHLRLIVDNPKKLLWEILKAAGRNATIQIMFSPTSAECAVYSIPRPLLKLFQPWHRLEKT